MESSHRPAPFALAVLLVVLAGWILHPAGYSHAAPPVFDKPGVTYHPDVKKCADCHPGAPRDFHVARPVDALCYRCHDQASSAKHMRESKAAGCVTCHEPDSSSKAFLRK